MAYECRFSNQSGQSVVMRLVGMNESYKTGVIAPGSEDVTAASNHILPTDRVVIAYDTSGNVLAHKETGVISCKAGFILNQSGSSYDFAMVCFP